MLRDVGDVTPSFESTHSSGSACRHICSVHWFNSTNYKQMTNAHGSPSLLSFFTSPSALAMHARGHPRDVASAVASELHLHFTVRVIYRESAPGQGP